MRLVEKLQLILNQDCLSIDEYLFFFKLFSQVYKEKYRDKVLLVNTKQIPRNQLNKLRHEVLLYFIDDLRDYILYLLRIGRSTAYIAYKLRLPLRIVNAVNRQYKKKYKKLHSLQ